MKKLFGILVLSFHILSCASHQSITKGGIFAGEKIKFPSRIVVMLMADGTGQTDGQWAGSGIAMSNGLRDVLIENSFFATVSESNKLEEAKSLASSLKCDYVIKSTITEWEDNATEWSGKPDSLSLTSELYDLQSSSFTSTASHREQSSGAALVPQSTRRFIPIAADRIIKRLFAIPMTKNINN